MLRSDYQVLDVIESLSCCEVEKGGIVTHVRKASWSSPCFPKREFDEEDHPFIHVINTDSASAVCQAPQGLKE